MPTVDWAAAREDWEAGLSLAKTAKKHGVSETAVASHRKKEGWVRGEAAALVTGVDAPTVSADELPQVAAAQRVAELEAELERVQREAASLRQDVEIHLPSTPKEAIEFYGRPYFEGVAMQELNRERTSRGFVAVELDSGHPTLEARVQKLAVEAVESQTKYANGQGSAQTLRTLKMARPDPTSPTGWFIAPIPIEPTINNGVAAPEAAVKKYTARGYRLITPALCQRGPCYAKAATDGGKFLYDGYCSAEHRAGDPFLNASLKKQVTGVAQSYGAAPAVVGVR